MAARCDSRDDVKQEEVMDVDVKKEIKEEIDEVN